MKPKILVVDDEPDALEILGFKLKEAGFVPIFARDGARALTTARDERPALIVLDLMLPEVDGLEVCKILRRDPTTATIPILMLTARAAEMDRVVGLEVGADDYVTKPFSPRELVLRIKKLLARANAPDETGAQFRLGELEIDVPRHSVTINGSAIGLTATEFKLLEILARRRGRVQTRERLLQEKIGDSARYLETIRGVGYRFKADE
jgi:two-component system phosphate regulon response regulator PhoB